MARDVLRVYYPTVVASEASANGATSFHESMGMLGDTEDKAKKPVVTPDTIKLPPMRKPNWMGQVEGGLLSASPPVIGPQARD